MMIRVLSETATRVTATTAATTTTAWPSCALELSTLSTDTNTGADMMDMGTTTDSVSIKSTPLIKPTNNWSTTILTRDLLGAAKQRPHLHVWHQSVQNPLLHYSTHRSPPLPTTTNNKTNDERNSTKRATEEIEKRIQQQHEQHTEGDIERFVKRRGDDYTMSHPLWSDWAVDSVEVTHKQPETIAEKLAFWTVKLIRFNFDWMSGWTRGKLTDRKVLDRILFLETVAGVPGAIGGILRHLNSLRRMKRDHGWINTLLQESENERMHLLSALAVQEPGWVMRLSVLVTQGIFYNFFFVSYLISPTFCHKLVAYIEEEAVTTYTKILAEIDHGALQEWKTTPAPQIAKDYWYLTEDATLQDMIRVIRADEAHHREVNHVLGDIKPDAPNPFSLKK